MQSLWMLVASLLFACMGVCVKFAAGTHSAVEITFYRAFISLILMFGLVRLRGVSLATPHWRWQVTRGAVGFAALFCYFYAITLLPLATAVTLNYTSAIFLALYLAFAGWRLNSGIVGALAVGLLGIALLLRPTLHADQVTGGLLGLASGAYAQPYGYAPPAEPHGGAPSTQPGPMPGPQAVAPGYGSQAAPADPREAGCPRRWHFTRCA